MRKDAGIQLSKLNVDGKFSRNNLLMQLQADISGIPILRAEHDTTSLGCAIAAAQADGINLIDLNISGRINQTIKIHHETFLPTTVQEERLLRVGKWKKAVERSYGWVQPKKDVEMTGNLLGYFYLGNWNLIFFFENFRGTLQNVGFSSFHTVSVQFILYASSFGNSLQTMSANLIEFGER
jgi:hypothetical protein